MAKDPRKRQKKLQRQKAKEKARKKAITEKDSQDMGTRLQRAALAPILHCCTTSALFDQGMGQVLISRELNNGAVAFVIFLVDMYCLGVKDVIFGMTNRGDYEWRVYAKMERDDKLVNLEPPAARKLVEGAVDFAVEAGFPPHRDYRKAKRIFGDIDANSCTEEFTYGKEGRPFFFAGPYDSPTRCRQIIDTLTNRCGPDGFDYVMHTSDPSFVPTGERVIDLDNVEEIEEWPD